jgi:hypothetical protein
MEMAMAIIQGRDVTPNDIQLIRQLIEENPGWNRTELSRKLCMIWNWRASSGQCKDMACRSLFLKLEKLGYITLPQRINHANNSLRNRSIPHVPHQKAPIQAELKAIAPIQIAPVQTLQHKALFRTLLAHYHYLGYSGAIGENMKYIVFDHKATPLACLLFGSAAWKIAPRDAFIGWDTKTRTQNLHLITNNMRFLILPWVRVPHLASHILGGIAQRISGDWIKKYGHPVYLLETFVERTYFRGICYRAANWRFIGQTKGRTRNDRHNAIRVPIKDVYLYPLTKNFREGLQSDRRPR